MNTTSGAELQTYINGTVLPLIRANWYRLVSKSGEKVGGEATIQFTIVRDGSITDAKLTDGSGRATLGDLAMNAVSRSGPFPPLPPNSAQPSVDVRTNFSYQPSAKDQFTAKSAGPQSPSYSHFCSSDETSRGSVECVTPPKPIYVPEPEFSEAARKKLTQGTVNVWATVAADGTVSHACVDQPLGDGLENKAVETILTWKFEPATMNGKPTEARVAVEVDFHLAVNTEGLPGPTVVPSYGGGNSGPKVTARVAEAPSPCTGQPEGCYTPPRVILSPLPEEVPPPGSRSAKYSGTATLQLTITTEGTPADIKVLKSLGHGLDEKAIAAVQKWKFLPATKNGKPVAMQIVVEIDFRLY